MVEVMRSGFNEAQAPMTENQLGQRQMMEEVAEHPDTPDSRYVAHPINDILFSWEEAGSAKNPITIDEDEDTSSSITTTATSSSSAFYREPPEHFC